MVGLPLTITMIINTIVPHLSILIFKPMFSSIIKNLKKGSCATQKELNKL